MSTIREIFVPDIGGFKDVGVIEVLVKPGDQVKSEESLITVESDKATMEIPSPTTGVVKNLKVKVGDKVSEGSLILTIDTNGIGASQPPSPAPGTATKSIPSPQTNSSASVISLNPSASATPVSAPAPKPASAPVVEILSARKETDKEGGTKPHASPSVRRFARELGVDLSRVSGSGPKGRITQEDVQAFIKNALSKGGAVPVSAPGLGFNLPEWPQVDFAKFGAIETKPLSRIKKLSGPALHRNWVSIPHVTQFDEADITELEAFRKAQGESAEKQGIKLTMLAFLVKAGVSALQKFPEFNASLDKNGENLILKKYFHIGIAVDTPEGLVVPIIRDADKKGILDIAKEMGEISKLAREKKLKPTDMQGGCFSISSLGGIGGTAFTPIINAPEIAILGVSRSAMKPVYQNGAFVPRLMLPLSLSYDHRVIDGALAARFTSYLAGVIGDIRKILL